MAIRLAASDADLRSCFAVMKQLRPGYREDDFVARVRRQEQDGYRLAMLVDGSRVVAVAGYRLGQNLAWRRFLYVEELVTDDSQRSSGHGARLLAWLRVTAGEAGCDELHLDSGVHRDDAHRFYLRQGMDIVCHHFAIVP